MIQKFLLTLSVEGALGLTLEERAKLASEARHALRLYARERCTLPDRLLAELFDGVRHMKTFGYWKSDGMDWSEIKLKYSREARRKLGATASPEDIDLYVYKRIIDRSCRTNVMFDNFVVSDVSQFKKLLELLDALKSSSQTLLPPSGTEQLKAIMFPVVALLQVDISV